MRSVWISALAILAMLAASCGSTEPYAVGMFTCNSLTLVREDYAALKRAATRAAAAHVPNWNTMKPCMNPGSGRVWISGEPEPQPDGTRVDIAAVCERRAGPWKCAVQEQRRYEFSAPVFGREQVFKLDIPMQLGVGEARAFAVQAFEKGATLTQLDACGRRADEPRGAHDDEYDRNLQSAFAIRERPVGGSIEGDAQGMTFWLDSYSLEFARASPSDPWAFKCWSQVIIVT